MRIRLRRGPHWISGRWGAAAAIREGEPPNLARSKVLEVRLNPEEFDAIERIAAAHELPASTITRDCLLKLIEGSGQKSIGPSA